MCVCVCVCARARLPPQCDKGAQDMEAQHMRAAVVEHLKDRRGKEEAD